MQVFTARQAIFNRQQDVVAYELLFRDGKENAFPDIDPHEATSKIIQRTHLSQGLGNVTEGKRALINFTEKCLLSGFAELLPPKEVIIEILETVNPTDEVYAKCEELYKKGYTLALDDFVYDKSWRRFFKFVKIIKFDIQQTPLKSVAGLINVIKKNSTIKVLAEKVETQEEYQHAMSLGVDFFQGYFFLKPEMTESTDIQPCEKVLHNLLGVIYKQDDDIDLSDIIDIYGSDVGLAYKLLKYINSGKIPKNQKITSIRQAVNYLGRREVKRLSLLLVTAQASAGKTAELLTMSAERAKTCEDVAKIVIPAKKEQAFLMGLISLIGVMLDKPLKDVLETLPVDEDIKKALLDKYPTKLRMIFRATELVQDGQWHFTSLECMKLGIEYDWLCEIYSKSKIWADKEVAELIAVA